MDFDDQDKKVQCVSCGRVAKPYHMFDCDHDDCTKEGTKWFCDGECFNMHSSLHGVFDLAAGVPVQVEIDKMTAEDRKKLNIK